MYRVLELLDLVEVADCFVGSEAEPVLSGSEMRRVAIGRFLPCLLVYDFKHFVRNILCKTVKFSSFLVNE